MSNSDKAIEILKGSHDGDALAPRHLALVELAVNRDLTEAGQQALDELHAQVLAGTYVQPWLHGIEHLSKNHEGYVFWKGHEVEHYSFRDFEAERQAANELARRCRILDARGEPVSTTAAVWKWLDEAQS